VEVVDTGYAYHVKTPGVEKGEGLIEVADALGLEPESFVAIGDSENDVSLFRVAGESYALANADDRAKAAADTVVGGAFSDGTLSVLRSLAA
jgi:hydroxymethylpyrimidine pyrophosphatase-like HAD family hydrolase